MRWPVFVIAAMVTYVPSLANAKDITADRIPYSTRAYWMRKANEALSLLSGPCPFGAFGTAIVNHTACPSGGLGELVCIGINNSSKTGNPTLHGEKLDLLCLGNHSCVLIREYRGDGRHCELYGYSNRSGW